MQQFAIIIWQKQKFTVFICFDKVLFLNNVVKGGEESGSTKTQHSILSKSIIKRDRVFKLLKSSKHHL